MKKYLTKEIQIALVAIVGLAVLFFGLKFLKGLSIFADEVTYNAAFEDISGLSVSCPVYADGYKVGVVKDIIYNYGEDRDIIAVLGIAKDMRLPKGTKAEIVSDMLGNIKIDLLLANNPKERIAPGETIKGTKNKGMLGMAGEMIPQVKTMLPKLDSILTNLNALMADPALKNSLHNVDEITANLTTTTRELNRMMTTVGKDMPQMVENANGILDNADKLTAKLNDIDIAATMAKIDATLANVEQLTAKLNSTEGTVGKFLNDPALYDNLNATVRSADSLMIDLKAHPKRYVHFSIFGKKDK